MQGKRMSADALTVMARWGGMLRAALTDGAQAFSSMQSAGSAAITPVVAIRFI